MEFERKFLINEDLVEIASPNLLHAKSTKQIEFLTASVKAVTGEVALVNTTDILPGFRYPSSTEGQRDFYLPKYVLRAVDGRFVTRLEMFPPSNDATEPAGKLTVEVQAVPLPASGAPVRVMAHDLRLRLGYHIPLGDVDDQAEVPSINGFTGLWTNSDPDSDGVVSLNISPAGGSRLHVHALQACQPENCDLGTVSCEVVDGTAIALFRGTEQTTSLTLSLDDNRLSVFELLDIHDPQNPGDFHARHSFNRAGDGPEPALIWFNLAPPAQVSSTVRRSVTTIDDMETYLRLYRVFTSGQHLARIEIRSTATVGRRSVRQVFVGLKDRRALLNATNKKVFKIEKKDAKEIRNKASRQILEQPGALTDPRIRMDIRKPVAASRVNPATAVPIDLALRMPVADAVVQPAPARSLRTRNMGNRINNAAMARRLAEAKKAAEQARDRARSSENLSIHFNQIALQSLSRSKLPRWVMVEENGEPVLTRREADCVQFISPIWVDAALYADQIDAPDAGEGGLVLLRQEIHAADQSATFFQDALSPMQVYYEPQEFRLVRSDSAPFAPMMLFHLNEEIDETAGDEDTSVFTVTMTYQARPYIHVSLAEAARLHFGNDVSIAPIVPAVSSLTIRLPSSGGGAENEITRDDVNIDFSDGISDTITFSESEFRQLTTAFQTVSGIGLTGHVDVVFLDGRSGQIPLRIGLRDTIGQVFTSSIEDGDGLIDFSYRLRNRIESPAIIDNLPVIALANNQRALPVADPPSDLIRPAETVTVGYRSDPPGGTGPDTLALNEVSVEPDMLAILSQTTVVQGYADDSFDITVSIDPMFFDFVPDGAEPITSVAVSFRTREEPAILTAAEPSKVVTLQMPKLLFLTNADAAQHYAYAVQDFHPSGPGLATAFRAGSGNLDVQPALAEIESV